MHKTEKFLQKIAINLCASYRWFEISLSTLHESCSFYYSKHLFTMITDPALSLTPFKKIKVQIHMKNLKLKIHSNNHYFTINKNKKEGIYLHVFGEEDS